MTYEELLKKARETYESKDTPHVVKAWLLANIIGPADESEDERIRKELIEQIAFIPPSQDELNSELDTLPCYNERIERYRSWLEKQGEQKQLYIRFGEIPTDEKSKIYQGEIEVGTEKGVSVYPAFKTSEGDIVLGLSLPITKTTLYTQQHLIEYDDRPCYLVNGDYVGKDTDGQPLIKNVSIIEKIDTYRVKEKKQCEQKFFDYENANIQQKDFASKVEPKFKVGDWVVFIASESIYQVEKIENYEYTLRHILGGSLRLSFSNEELIREWTIADAKEGDVIYVSTEVKGIQAIFHKFENGIIYFHCNLCTDFTQGGYEPSGDVEFVMPLPKIHYQKFFQKMKEAGYEWDSEKKELKKIEVQKNYPVIKEEEIEL